MKIPVFLSCPTHLSASQEESRDLIAGLLDELNLEPRALGRSDYPTELPLREVLVIAKHSAGGMILGFNQFTARGGVFKPGSASEKKTSDQMFFPTAWNHLEAGILFSLGRPLMVFREPGISGGVFDHGVADVFVNEMPTSATKKANLREAMLKWRDRVGAEYYR
ncbi:MAG: hypothetical protein INF92_03620 [Rhodobacter sp.]|nr:hypothetical protein [Rhodobacter sp.]